MEAPTCRGSTKWRAVKHQYNFFYGYRLPDLECEDEKFVKLMEIVRRANNNCESISTFITRLAPWMHLEGYIAEGIRFKDRYSRWSSSLYAPTKPLNFYDKNVIKFFKEYDIEVTRELEEKYGENPQFYKTLICNLRNCELAPEDMSDAYYLLQHNNYIQTLVQEYGYNLKALLGYIYNYLKPFENLSPRNALNELCDYYRMGRVIGRKVKKYPKYLRSMHDIIMANYESYKKEYDELLFKECVRDELEYTADNKFVIVLPETSKDIVREGTDLNHCVSSYVDKIMRKETFICFLRLKKKKDESLVTVEVIGDRIVQAKGSYNRKMTDEERKFLEKFGRVKKLRYEV